MTETMLTTIEAIIDKICHCVFYSILIILIFTTIEHIIKMVIAQKCDDSVKYFV